MIKGISVRPTIGIGDQLQYSSLPENYFMAMGEKLVDVSKSWFFDHNPYVVRDVELAPDEVQELWNFSPHQYQWPRPPRREARPEVYLSNAEIWASLFKVPVVLNRPRLYQYEDFPFELRTKILIQLKGISHGEMPVHIVEHILKKYCAEDLAVIGPVPKEWQHQNLFNHIETPTLWDLALVISEAKMLIGMDSAPAWIAACYPDVIVKKVRTKPRPGEFEDWVPLEIRNIHSHWDDRCHMIYNPTDRDIGFTSSYRRI